MPANPWWRRAVGLLPLSVCQQLGALIGWAVYWGSSGYRAKFNTQWAAASTWVEAQKLAPWSAVDKRLAIAHGGQMAMEALWVWCRPNSELIEKIVCNDTALFSQLKATERGIIFLTPHLSCFEAVGRYCASFQPMTALFKPSKFDLVNSLTQMGRNVHDLTMAPADVSGVRKLFRALKTRQAIGLLPDQVPPLGQGVWADFFGRPAYCIDLPVKLAKMSNASVVMIVCERLAIGQGWQMHLELLESDLLAPADINLAMQRWIAKRPSQYLWGYNRFKDPVAA
jgi:Kdo2-lipid IVA lauroyltransferase/acyltransferase